MRRNTRSTLLPALLLLGSFSLAPVQAAGRELITIGNAQLAVVLGAMPTPPEVRVKELFAERLLDRSGITLATVPDAAVIRIVAGTVASNDKLKTFASSLEDLAALGADGYAIEVDAANNEIHVLGQSDSGVVAGVGRLMREMRYHPGKVEVPALRIAESPRMPNRGMYLWARKFYLSSRYLESNSTGRRTSSHGQSGFGPTTRAAARIAGHGDRRGHG